MVSTLRRRGSGRIRAAAAVGGIAALVTASPVAAQTAVGGTAAGGTAGWPQIQGGATHTGYTASENSVTSKNVRQLTVAWTQALPTESYDSQVTVAGMNVYVSAGNNVIAYNAVSGTQLWQATLATGTVLGTPSVQGDLVVVGTDLFHHPKDQFSIVALDTATGGIVWSRRVSPMQSFALAQMQSVTTTSDRVYASLAAGQVLALALQTGRTVWESAVVPGCYVSQPSVSGGTVVVNGGGQAVSALNASTGAVLWQDTLGTQCSYGSQAWLPAISQGTVYTASYSSIAAIDLSSGAIVWQNTSVGGEPVFPMSVTADKVIAGVVSTNSDPSTLQALSRSDGSLVWQSPAKKLPDTVATFGGLSWGTALNGVEAFNAATGRLAYSGKSQDGPYDSFAPVVDAGRVYVNTGSDLECLALPG